MAANLILTKESSASEIKAYFNAILKLSQSDNEFPINLDEVWPLVYKDKKKAVEHLKENFIKDIDYEALPQKVECQNGIGSSRVINYFLSLPCLEYFIARKVRPVFDVYREVFHRTVSAALPLQQPTEKPTAKMEDSVDFIFICHQIGLPESDILAMVSQLIPTVGTLSSFTKACIEMRDKCAVSLQTMRRIVSLYAMANGLPRPVLDIDEPVFKTEEKAPETFLTLNNPVPEKESSPLEEPNVAPAGEYSQAAEIGEEARMYMRAMKRGPLSYNQYLNPRNKGKIATMPHRLSSPSLLLRSTGHANISTAALNNRLWKHGILCKQDAVGQKDSKGRPRAEWQVTLAGAEFGMNSQSRDTLKVRPLWWCDKFEEMLQLVGLIDADPKGAAKGSGKEGAAL